MPRMLVAVDLAEEAERVVDLVAPWAEKLGMQVDLVHVTPMVVPMPEIPDAEVQALLLYELQRTDTVRKERLERLLERLPAERRGHGSALIGPIATTLVDLAADYELVALASHGRTGLQRVWLGSVAEKVVRLSPKPVLVLRLA